MPLPTSRAQIEKLGKRLAADTDVAEADLNALEDLVVCQLSDTLLEGLAGDDA